MMNEVEKAKLERRNVLTELLDNWRNFFDEPAASGLVVVDDQTREVAEDWSLFSSMQKWPSVVEMRRCVELMARMAPGHYRHLMAYTAYVEWRLVDRPVKRRDHRNKLVDDVERVRERIVPEWISRDKDRLAVYMRMVNRALDFVLGVWARDVPLELPPALVRKLRPLADSDGWTEAA